MALGTQHSRTNHLLVDSLRRNCADALRSRCTSHSNGWSRPRLSPNWRCGWWWTSFRTSPRLLGLRRYSAANCWSRPSTSWRIFAMLNAQNQSQRRQSIGVSPPSQVLNGPNYAIWDVTESMFQDSSDFALLRLGANPARSEVDEPHQWKQPIVNPFAPDVGERVAAFGYRRSRIVTSINSQGGRHIDLDDEMMASVGIVRERFEFRRDRRMLPFPCYRVGGRFDGGMSGGPVFDEFGSLCGIVCSSFHGPEREGEPISHVATLWPLFGLGIDFDRGDKYPRGVQYPAIELARGGQIKVSDLPRLENWFSFLQQLPRP